MLIAIYDNKVMVIVNYDNEDGDDSDVKAACKQAPTTSESTFPSRMNNKSTHTISPTWTHGIAILFFSPGFFLIFI